MYTLIVVSDQTPMGFFSVLANHYWDELSNGLTYLVR